MPNSVVLRDSIDASTDVKYVAKGIRRSTSDSKEGSGHQQTFLYDKRRHTQRGVHFPLGSL